MMEDWAQLTVSDGHFLDEIAAALRDAQIPLRLGDPVDQPQRGVRTRFGAREHASKVIEVPRARLADAEALLREIFDGAEEAAQRESGAPAPTAEERDEEQAWRAEVERKRERSARRVTWTLRIILGGLALALVVAVLFATFLK